jgi:hypothetical protein
VSIVLSIAVRGKYLTNSFSLVGILSMLRVGRVMC